MTQIKVAAGIILQKSSDQIWQVLIAKRPDDKHQGGLWEFPGGKIEQSESEQAALTRELKEELDISIDQAEHFKQVEFDYGDKKVAINFFLIYTYKGKPTGLEGQMIRWVNIDQLNHYNFPQANQSVVDSLINLY